MRRNIELKAKCADPAAAREAARALGAHKDVIVVQTDTYFHVPHGRLKLREIEGQGAELIWYARSDVVGLRASDYLISSVGDAAALLTTLSSALGVGGRVCKRRELWLLSNVRIHLDEVEQLGTFIEFEAVIEHPADDSALRDLLERLTLAMKIQSVDLISGSYLDLMREIEGRI